MYEKLTAISILTALIMISGLLLSGCAGTTAPTHDARPNRFR